MTARTADRTPWLPQLLVWLVIVAAAAVRLRLLQVPLERDEGEYAYAGQLLLQGVPPYQLAFNMKFPGTYAAYALIMALFGQSIGGIHLGFLVVNAGTIILLYLLGKRLFTAAAGAAAGAAYALLSVGAGVFGTQAHATHFVVLAALGGTLLLWQALRDQRAALLFWSGLLYGVAVLMKQHGILFAVFGGWYVVRNHWSRLGNVRPGLTRKLVLYCGGVAAPLALTGILLWRAGVFDKFWFWTVSYARQYALEIPFSGGMELLRGTIPGVVGPNGAIWLTAAAGLILVSWKKLWWKKDDRETALFLAGLLFFSFLAVCPGFYFREHYFVLMLPAVALLAGGAVSAVSRMMPGAWWHHAVYCGVLVFSVMQQKEFLFRMTPAQVSRTMYGTNPFPEAVQIADYIRTHSTKNARIAVLGSEPEIPFYADRRSATGYIYTYGLMEPQPFAMKMQTEMIQELAASRPEFVVFVGIHTSWLRRPDSPPVLFDWWRIYGPQHYRLAGIIDIVAADRTVYRWEDVEAYKPQSENLIAVYKRTGS